MIDFYPDPLPVVETALASQRLVRAVCACGDTPGTTIAIAAAPARPPHLAEREELDAALHAGTADSLLLFIERHPNSRYRAEAETELRRLGIVPPQR